MILPNVVFCAAGVVRVVGNGTDLRLYGDNGNYVQIDPGSPGSNYTLVMPSSLGTEGQWYKLGSAGQLTFASITTDDVSGLGTAATLDVGTGANDIVQLNGSGQLPAVDGSLLTGITAEAEAHTHVLADITDAGTAAGQNVGTSAYNVVQLDGSGYLPGVDGSQLTNINANVAYLDNIGNVTISSATTNDLLYYSSGTWYNGSLATIGIAAASHTHSLSDITNAGSAAAYDVGTGAGNIVQLDGSGLLPAVDGSQLTNVIVSNLDNISDVGISSVLNYDLLYHYGGVWYNGSLATIGIAAASHTHSLSDITDAGTAAGYNVGTSAGNIVQLDGSGLLPTVDGSALINLPPTYETRCLSFAVFDSSTNTSIGNGTIGAVIAASLNGYELTDATASVHTAGTTNTTDIQVRRRRSGSDVDMLSTAVTINSGAYTASDGVINTSNDDVQTGDMIYIDVDAISTTPAIGLSVVLTFTKP